MFTLFKFSKFFSFERLPEEIALKKNEYLRKAQIEAHEAHPLSEPSSLYCPISFQPFKQPVITKKGFVYEKAKIQSWILKNPSDPLTREILLFEDLYPFSELKNIVSIFESRKNEFLKHQKQLVKRAFTIAHQHLFDKDPDLFICPLSKKIIKEAVISSDGMVYDKSALGNSVTNLGFANHVPFDEFQQQINVFLYYKEQNKSATHCIY